MHFTITTLALATALLLAGCGQMGPLYEPEESTPASSTSAASTTS